MPPRQPPAGAGRDLGEVLDFLRILWAIEHHLKSASKYMQKRLGITGPQRLVLRIAERFPGITAGELADILQLHPSTLTGVVDRLVQRRLIVRARDPRDARRVRLTAARRRTPPVPTVEAAVKRAFRQVTPLQIEHACAVLDAVVGSLEAHATLHAGKGRPAAAPRNRSATRRAVRRG